FPPKNINEILFSKYQLKDYLKQNKCILDQLKQSGYLTNFIHTYKSTFNNRVSYYDFFDKTYFLEDLVKLNFASDCYWDEAGICDYQVIERFNELFDLTKNKNLFYFLTLNGHVFPRDYFVKKNETRQDCTILDLNNDLMCKVYNNQIQFNKSLNQFIKNNLRKNDLVIAIGDTPPFFLKKKYKRLFINDYVPVFLIEKK
ncbi:MAG: sulfatase-like hydrolase/transferase, partial [Alphaproteobacteria bacterium]